MAEDLKPQAAGETKHVINLVHGAVETPLERMIKKLIPAWFISSATHLLISSMIVVPYYLGWFGQERKVSTEEIAIAVDAPEEDKPDDANLLEEIEGIDPEVETSVEAPVEDKMNIESQIHDTNIGTPDANPELATPDFLAPSGSESPTMEGGVDTIAPGIGIPGSGGADGLYANNSNMIGRGGATKNLLLNRYGGTQGSELAVGRGLAWLAKQQRSDGYWRFDGSSNDDIAATGMALLPFLAAGQTHKKARDPRMNKYQSTVLAGLNFLIGRQKSDGSFTGASGMYSHAIATVALTEAFGMTSDKGLLRLATQKAINYIQTAQASDGSWGYQAKREGDTSIVGWQLQALQSARLCKDLVVNKEVINKASKFLDKVSSGKYKEQYGYRSPGGRDTLTSVGLLCRYYIDAWGPTHPGMSNGAAYLMKTHGPSDSRFDMYYYYYATQVMHFHEGDLWHKSWNPVMRERLINLQVKDGKGKAADVGSWDKDQGSIGRSCGRLGTTCLALLTLEVYYRHLPLTRRDAGGLRELERGR